MAYQHRRRSSMKAAGPRPQTEPRPAPGLVAAQAELARRAPLLAALGLDPETPASALLWRSPHSVTGKTPDVFNEVGRSSAPRPGPLTSACLQAWQTAPDRPLAAGTPVPDATAHAGALKRACAALRAAEEALRFAPAADPEGIARWDAALARSRRMPAPNPYPLNGTPFEYSPDTDTGISTTVVEKHWGEIHVPESPDGYRPAGETQGWIARAKLTHAHPEGLTTVALQDARERLAVYAERMDAYESAQQFLTAAYKAADKRKANEEALRAAIAAAADALNALIAF